MADFASFERDYCAPGGVPLTIEYARMEMPDTFFASMEPRIAHAFDEMEKLEAGAIANPDEGRMVGHYWLRDFARLPGSALRDEVEADYARVLEFLAGVSSGRIAGSAGPFRHLLSVGIGGSALGPQLLADALGHPETDKLRPIFLDNTDPDGIARELTRLKGDLSRTLTVVISKSGGTPETRNGMLLVEEEYKRAGLDFGRHAVAVTGAGSRLDKYAEEGGWLARLPMYDWVGGRTSLWSAVGLIPAGLQGIDVGRLLAGAAAMDGATRVRDARANPAALLALCWFHGTGGRGERDMVVIPYKDRLALMSRYLQQLIMESLGKEHDLDGAVVEQGIAVYGNKGSTDQHAYVQQLRDGVPNFFATFIEVLEDGGRDDFAVEAGVTAGDYLLGFLLGTRQALSEKGRRSLTITLERVDAFSVGALLALHERAVGFYASLVNINAYHQPGVEAGKKAAAAVLGLQHSLMAKLRGGGAHTASEWASQLGGDAETCYKILEHLAANRRGVVREGSGPGARFRAAG